MNLSIQNLSKTYSNGLKALNNINLEIGSGMFGLLGPNGAGKSTLFNILESITTLDSGKMIFANRAVIYKETTNQASTNLDEAWYES